VYEKNSPAEKAFILFLYVLRCLTIRFYIALLPEKWRVPLTELYHLIVLVLLLIISKIHPSKELVLGSLIYLSNEFVVWSLFDVLIEAREKRLQGRRNPLRAIMWVLYAGIVLMWINGIYFYISRDFGRHTDTGFISINRFSEGIYYSISNMFSLGIVQYEVAEHKDLSKLILILEPLIGLGILLFYLAVFVSGLSNVFAESIIDEKNTPTKEEVIREQQLVVKATNLPPLNQTTGIYKIFTIIFYLVFSLYTIYRSLKKYKGSKKDSI